MATVLSISRKVTKFVVSSGKKYRVHLLLRHLKNLNTCTLEEIPNSSLQKAEAYLNLLRSWLDLPPITMIQTVLQQQCAHILGHSFNRVLVRKKPMLFISVKSSDNRMPIQRLRYWTSLEMLEITLSLSSIPLRLVGLERRHQHLSADLNQISTGRYNQIESIAPRKPSIRASSPCIFQFTLGVGTLPLELVSEGNNHRAKVPWSIACPTVSTKTLTMK